MRSITRMAALLLCALAALALVTGPAYAVNYWAKPTTPLAAKTDGVTQGRAFGYHEVDQTENGTRSHAETRLYDQNPGGSGIYIKLQTYVNAGICFAPDYTSCQQPYYPYAEDGSARWKESRWSAYGWTLGTTGLPGEADYARGSVRVCEDQNNSPDDCSGWAYSAGSKY